MQFTLLIWIYECSVQMNHLNSLNTARFYSHCEHEKQARSTYKRSGRGRQREKKQSNNRPDDEGSQSAGAFRRAIHHHNQLTLSRDLNIDIDQV